jgi:hypothetical protein
MTQTVILTQPVRVSGSVLAAGTTQTLARDIAADLVARGFATPVGFPVWQYPAQNVEVAIFQSNIPILIMPGDGGANGCSFSGTAGAFTLSAAIIANIGASLSGCYAYFSASFGGSSLPAGWYWTEFSSDTAGIVYANTYSGGTPRRPVTKTPISVNLSGRITATTNEVVAFTGIRCPANAIGKNGSIKALLGQTGSVSGTKSFKVMLETTVIVATGTSTSPTIDSLHIITCEDSHTNKILGRSVSTAQTGVTQESAFWGAANRVSVNTAVDTNLSVSLQQSTNISTPILFRLYITTTYGE